MINYEISFKDAVVINSIDGLIDVIQSFVVEVTNTDSDYKQANLQKFWHTQSKKIELPAADPMNFIDFQNISPEILTGWIENIIPGQIDQMKNVLAIHYQAYLRIINPDPNISVKQFAF
jgi:hypothetical protein